MKRTLFFLPAFFFVFFITCTTKSIDSEETVVTINFDHSNNNASLVMDQNIYTNAAGQNYSIKTVRYFISHVTLHQTDGPSYTSPDIHFIDIRDTKTLSLTLSKRIPFSSYSSISFVYGLVPEDNITGSLGLNLDRLMEWPVPMGGGYHYMKLEGDYEGSTGSNFFNFHSGSLNKVDYSIPVTIPFSNMVINEESITFNIVMNIGNWFQNPVDWNFEYWGSGIMGNSDAQATVQKNGANVFSVIFPSEIN